jgi:hypothetical protein
MIFQCTIEREGNTQMFLDRFEYVFKPRPELTGNDVDKVCQVASRRHQEKFASMDGFNEWKPTVEQSTEAGPSEITPFDIERMREMKANGLSVHKIVEELSDEIPGLTWQKVSKLLKNTE